MSQNIYNQDLNLANSNNISQKLFTHYQRKVKKNGGILLSTILEKGKEYQYQGIDRRLVIRKDNETYYLKVEEKIRRKFYNDFLFEIISNDTENINSIKNIGWIKKDLSCDLISFYFIEKDKCYIFNWNVFKKTYELYGAEWIKLAINNEKGFRLVYAINKTYKSHNLIVPKDIFIKAYIKIFNSNLD